MNIAGLLARAVISFQGIGIDNNLLQDPMAQESGVDVARYPGWQYRVSKVYRHN